MAPLASGTAGDKLAAQIWREVMDEFKFAGVEKVVRGMAKMQI